MPPEAWDLLKILLEGPAVGLALGAAVIAWGLVKLNEPINNLSSAVMILTDEVRDMKTEMSGIKKSVLWLERWVDRQEHEHDRHR
jgi:hypothetical protein